VPIFFIDVDNNLKNERLTSRKLEEALAQEDLDVLCEFTVVPNAFVALDCTEHANFHLIFAVVNLPNLNAVEMIRVLRNVGNNTPLMLIVNKGNTEEMTVAESAEVSPFVFGVMPKPIEGESLIPEGRANLKSTIQHVVSITRGIMPNVPILSKPSRAVASPREISLPNQILSHYQLQQRLQELQRHLQACEMELYHQQYQQSLPPVYSNPLYERSAALCPPEVWTAYENLGFHSSSTSSDSSVSAADQWRGGLSSHAAAVPCDVIGGHAKRMKV
jgi:CheY-like chemotaxis protein